MSIAGQMRIGLGAPGYEAGVAIDLGQPLDLNAAFACKPVATVVDTVPLLFAVCGVAQGVAAASAAEAALGHASNPATAKARHALVLAEIAREHMIRILGDWPDGAGAAKPALTDALRLDRALRASLDPGRSALKLRGEATAPASEAADQITALSALIARQVLGITPAAFLAIATATDLADWAADGHTPAQRLIHGLMSSGEAFVGAVVCQPLDDPTVLSPSDHHGPVGETTPLSRMIAAKPVMALIRDGRAGLAARLVAQLAELAAIPDRLRATLAPDRPPPPNGARSPAPGEGLAHIEAARGRLTHRLIITQDVIARYEVIAPTRWNFHSAGVAACALARLPAGPNRLALAKLLVLALNPCVPFAITEQRSPTPHHTAEAGHA